MEQGIRIRRVILLWLLLSTALSLQSQSAGDIDTLSQWRVDISWTDGYGIYDDCFKFYISGTEIKDSLVYYKVYKSGYQYEFWSATYSFYQNQYVGLLREQDNKWYSENYYSGNGLLYDFTLEVGDTVISTTAWDDITVTNIDTILIDNEFKKRFHLSCAQSGYTQYIIEDIGSSSGLFQPLSNWFEHIPFMHCYAIDFIPLWINPGAFECDLAVGINEYKTGTDITTYPNPFTTSTTLEFELKGNSEIHVSIYNAMGALVYQSRSPGPSVSKSPRHKITWSPGHLPAGLYYGVLRRGDGVSVVKMVKE
jgi:hypothetical protein